MTLVLATTFLLLVIGISYVIRKNRASRVAERSLMQESIGLAIADLRAPKGMYFHPGHTWVSLMNGGNVRVGVDDFISKLTGPVTDIEIPEVGTEVAQGAPALKMKFDSKLLHLPIPVSGTVQKVNQTMMEQPSRIGTKTLAKEWLIDIKPSRLSEELHVMNIAEQVRQWIGKEIERIKEFLVSQSGRPELVGGSLPDGGEPVVGVLNMLDAEGLQQFEKSFIRV